MTPKDIHALWERFHTPDHVREHCRQVARVGKVLAETLKNAGKTVDPTLVWQTGLLHDVVRVVDFKSLDPTLGTPEDQSVWQALRKEHQGRHHADVGAEILKEIGEDRLGDIVQRHRYSALGTPEGPQDLESKLLFYADKRVAHTQIVPIEERLKEGHGRHYPGEPLSEEELERRKRLKALEKELFEGLPFGPNELAQRIEQG